MKYNKTKTPYLEYTSHKVTTVYIHLYFIKINKKAYMKACRPKNIIEKYNKLNRHLSIITTNLNKINSL